ncbi:MAG TPA: class I SAM-dependent methyltransferase [Bradyrhizobium sp.]|nr:class I SAM-dependent methyltransferase [Bradyrhizobium sp.]
MSRLDSFIRRLEAQRACLELAADLVAGMDGDVLELGLGNGRTYDHLRKLFPHRKIYVCERTVAAHPDCVPPPQFLLLGDMRETLPTLRARLAERVVLAHLDPGNGEIAASRALADQLAPLIVPLLQLNGVLVSEPAITADRLSALPLPGGIEPGRYNLYRRINRRSLP